MQSFPSGHSYTPKAMPCSPPDSPSDEDFAFPVSPRKSCPAVADELFYKGQLLPLHISPRISMLRSLLASHDSPSADFTKDPKPTGSDRSSSAKLSSRARKYLRKMKPLYEKLRRFNQPERGSSSVKPSPASSCFPNTAPFWSETRTAPALPAARAHGEIKVPRRDSNGNSKNKTILQSFSGNLRVTRKRCVDSFPKSGSGHGESWRREEDHTSIQAAIAHCKNSLAC